METPACEPLLVPDTDLADGSGLVDEDVWHELLSKLRQDPVRLEIICKLLCCSEAMPAVVRRACEGSVSVILRPYKCAFGKVQGR
jgi:hypothetical protein